MGAETAAGRSRSVTSRPVTGRVGRRGESNSANSPGVPPPRDLAHLVSRAPGLPLGTRMRPSASGGEPSFLPGHQTFVSQKVGAHVKFWFLGPVTGTSTPAEK